MADGTYVNGWCLLTAVDGGDGEVLAWQWCDRESTAAYKALFAQLAPPGVLVCDGMKGIQRASAETWPDTQIQRCLVHVQRDTRADLTSKPRLQAGRELKGLADMLTRVHDAEAAARWGGALNAWHERWKTLLAERTYAKDNPDDPRAATSKGGWWWTHLPLRRAYFRLERLFKDGTLFRFLDPALTTLGPVPRDSNRLEGGLNAALKRMLVNHRGLPEAKDGTLFRFLDPALTTLGPVPRDSNRLEGGLNAALKRMLVNHRGLPEAHMRRACEWHCYMNSAKPDPNQILKQHDRDAKATADDDNEPTSQPTNPPSAPASTGTNSTPTPATQTAPTRSLNQHKMTYMPIFSASSLLVLPVRWPMICKQEKRPAVRVPPAFQREEKKKEGVSS